MSEADWSVLGRIKFGIYLGREGFRLSNLSHDSGGCADVSREWKSDEDERGGGGAGEEPR